MAKTCMICGEEGPYKFQIKDEERKKYPDPEQTELEIHIKRTHSLDEIQKYIDPTGFKKRQQADKAIREAAEAGEEITEQETEKAPDTDELIKKLFEKQGGGRKSSGGKKTRSRTRSRKKREETSEPEPEEAESGETEGNE